MAAFATDDLFHLAVLVARTSQFSRFHFLSRKDRLARLVGRRSVEFRPAFLLASHNSSPEFVLVMLATFFYRLFRHSSGQGRIGKGKMGRRNSRARFLGLRFFLVCLPTT